MHNENEKAGDGDEPADCEVGNKRPPAHTPFKAGVSGNPKGSVGRGALVAK